MVFRGYKVRGDCIFLWCALPLLQACLVMYTINNLRMILHSETDLLSLKLCKLCERLQMTSKLRPVISSGQLPFLTCWPTAVKLMVRCHDVCTGVYPVIEQTTNGRI